MNDPHPPESADPDDLQFDEAEYAEEPRVGLNCAACKKPIDSSYYEINGQVVCDGCRGAIEAGSRSGSRVARFAKAFVFGSGAGVVGFAIYFAVMKLANMEFSLISILVGFLVGKAVYKGSGDRGGWPYQLLAIFLTYSVIVASYSAMVIPGMIAAARQQPQQIKPAPGAPAAPGGQPVAPGMQPAPRAPAMPLGKLLLMTAELILAVLAFLYSFPIQANLQQPIGLLIIAFALWNAWKFNVRHRLVFNGPFRVGDADKSAPRGWPSHA